VVIAAAPQTGGLKKPRLEQNGRTWVYSRINGKIAFTYFFGLRLYFLDDTTGDNGRMIGGLSLLHHRRHVVWFLYAFYKKYGNSVTEK